MANINFNDLFNDMLNNEEDLPVSKFNPSILSGLSDSMATFWKLLVDKLKKSPTDDLGFSSESMGTSVGNSEDDSSVFNYLQFHIDLQPLMDNPDVGNFWNESVIYLMNIFDLAFNDKAEIVDNITVSDIKNADAANSFVKNLSSKWVIPWTNIDGNNYSVVRSDDAIYTVLTDSSEMQFTHKGVEQWIRLIMPKYMRYVEVEDLNRNFWVIGQALTGICNFLFGENGPFQEIVKQLLDEIIQIWQNLLYLWATYALLSQKPFYTNIHTEVVPIPNDSIRNYIKFDNFEYNSSSIITGILSELWNNRYQYLKDSYVESNLCVIPVLRDNNYKHNYYSKERYLGAILFDRNAYNGGEDRNIYLKTVVFGTQGFTVSFDDEHIAQNSGAINNIEDNLKYIEQFSNISNIFDIDEQIFYGVLRTQPTVDVEYDDSLSGNKVKLNSFELKVNDVTRILSNKSSNGLVKTYTWTNGGDGLTEKDNNVTISNPNQIITIEPNKGYYLGELVSCQAKVQEKPVDFSIRVQKLDGINEANSLANPMTIKIQNLETSNEIFSQELSSAQKEYTKDNAITAVGNYNIIEEYKGNSERKYPDINFNEDFSFVLSIDKNGVIGGNKNTYIEQEIKHDGESKIYDVPLRYKVYNETADGKTTVNIIIKNPRDYSSAFKATNVHLKPFLSTNQKESISANLNITGTNDTLEYADGVSDVTNLTTLQSKDKEIIQKYIDAQTATPVDSALNFYYGYHDAGFTPEDTNTIIYEHYQNGEQSFYNLSSENENLLQRYYEGSHSGGFFNVAQVQIAGVNTPQVYSTYHSPKKQPNVYAWSGGASSDEAVFFFLKNNDNYIKEDNWFIMMIRAAISNLDENPANAGEHHVENANAFISDNDSKYHICGTVTVYFFFPKTLTRINGYSLPSDKYTHITFTRQSGESDKTLSNNNDKFYKWDVYTEYNDNNIVKTNYEKIVKSIGNDESQYRLFKKFHITGFNKDFLANGYGTVNWDENKTDYTYY